LSIKNIGQVRNILVNPKGSGAPFEIMPGVKLARGVS